MTDIWFFNVLMLCHEHFEEWLLGNIESSLFYDDISDSEYVLEIPCTTVLYLLPQMVLSHSSLGIEISMGCSLNRSIDLSDLV